MASESTSKTVYRFKGRATGEDPTGYYHPRWDRAVPVSVLATTRAEATSKAFAMLGTHPSVRCLRLRRASRHSRVGSRVGLHRRGAAERGVRVMQEEVLRDLVKVHGRTGTYTWLVAWLESSEDDRKVMEEHLADVLNRLTSMGKTRSGRCPACLYKHPLRKDGTLVNYAIGYGISCPGRHRLPIPDGPHADDDPDA